MKPCVPRQRVADRDPHAYGWPAGLSGEVAEPAHRFGDARRSRPVSRYGAGLAVAGDANHDQVRVDRAQVVPAQAPPFERPGPEVLDHDVGRGGQRHEKPLPCWPAKVERDRLLFAGDEWPVQADALVLAAPAAHRVACTGRLDLDHFGAVVGEQVAAERAADHLAGLDDTRPAQSAAARRHADSDCHGWVFQRGPARMT